MKENWQTKKIGDVCSIVNGGTPDTSIPEFWDGEYLWITPKDMGKLNSIYVDDTPRKITSAGLKNSSAKMLPVNSIILSSRAPIGHLAINTKAVSTNQGCKGLIPQKDVSALYVFYFLKKSVDLLNKLGSGATFKELSSSKLAEVEIPIPPLAEQQRIVAILDEAFAVIAQAKENAEKNLQNARELFDSYLQSVFANPGDGWEERKLSDVCSFTNGQAHERIIDENGNYKLINSKFISSNGEIYKKTSKALSPLFRGDIAMVMSDVPKGKTLAKCFLVDKDETYTLNQRICVIRSNQFEKRFLYYQLNRHKYLLAFDNGENQTNLRKNDILNCPLFVPPIVEQRAVISKLDDLSAETKKLENIYRQKINDLDELKKSILNKAFSGELTAKRQVSNVIAVG